MSCIVKAYFLAVLLKTVASFPALLYTTSLLSNKYSIPQYCEGAF